MMRSFFLGAVVACCSRFVVLRLGGRDGTCPLC